VGIESTRGLIIFVMGVFGLFYVVVVFVVVTVLALRYNRSVFVDLKADSRASWFFHNMCLPKEKRKALKKKHKEEGIAEMKRIRAEEGVL
jgi:hypothetical protein